MKVEIEQKERTFSKLHGIYMAVIIGSCAALLAACGGSEPLGQSDIQSKPIAEQTLKPSYRRLASSSTTVEKRYTPPIPTKNGYLVFSSQDQFDKMVEAMTQSASESESLRIHAMGEYTSLGSIFAKEIDHLNAMVNNLASSDKSEYQKNEEIKYQLNKLKGKYPGVFNIKSAEDDQLEMDMNLYSTAFSDVVNEKGLVQIADRLYHYSHEGIKSASADITEDKLIHASITNPPTNIQVHTQLVSSTRIEPACAKIYNGLKITECPPEPGEEGNNNSPQNEQKPDIQCHNIPEVTEGKDMVFNIGLTKAGDKERKFRLDLYYKPSYNSLWPKEFMKGAKNSDASDISEKDIKLSTLSTNAGFKLTSEEINKEKVWTVTVPIYATYFQLIVPTVENKKDVEPLEEAFFFNMWVDSWQDKGHGCMGIITDTKIADPSDGHYVRWNKENRASRKKPYYRLVVETSLIRHYKDYHNDNIVTDHFQWITQARNWKFVGLAWLWHNDFVHLDNYMNYTHDGLPGKVTGVVECGDCFEVELHGDFGKGPKDPIIGDYLIHAWRDGGLEVYIDQNSP